VRSNLFSGNFHGGIVVAPELYWAEADYSRNLRIESNTVSEAGYAKWSYGAIGVGATIPHGQKGNGGGTTFASGAGHASVSIVNNTVEDCDTWGIWVSSVVGLLLSDNRIQRSYERPTWATYPPPYPLPPGTLIFITESSDALVRGNCVLDPGPYVASIFNATATVALQNGSQSDFLCDAALVRPSLMRGVAGLLGEEPRTQQYDVGHRST
jgi:hypothetical protein